MEDQKNYSDLEAFAKKKIAAERYQNDFHFFGMCKCDECGIAPFTLTIEHHTGSRKGNFKGIITGLCQKCGKEKQILSFTGKHRKPMRTENPVCKCGHKEFLVGKCDRIEREDGMMGFFDEGVVAGKCTECGENCVFVYTD